MDASQSVPESLLVSVDQRSKHAIELWWESLTADQRSEFLQIASFAPETIARPLDLDDLGGDKEPNEWFEYVVNQDLRFYFDRSDPPENDAHHHVVYPIMVPISTAAEIEVVNHLLYSPRRERRGMR